jgi:hypothetical protein
MRIRLRLIGAVLLTGIFGVGVSSPAFAGRFFKDVWGVVTDPLKLDKASSELSSSVDRSLIQLSALEGSANAHVEQRLDQIRSILNEAIDRENISIASAISQMETLEDSINDDAISLVYRGQCVAEVAMLDQAQRGFAAAIDNLIKTDPGIRILGITIITFHAKHVQIDDPDKAYISARDNVMSKLRETTNDSTDAYEILSAYQNLERAARFARCHYIDQDIGKKYTKEINELERLSDPWVSVVDVTM